jgi:large subunit ribosomal protein L4
MSEISGTTAKPHKQKGTGRARQGSKRSVQFVGGRTCHGPKTRSFEYTANKKAKEKSKIDCLKVKLSSGNLSIINVGKELLNTSKLSKFVSGNNLGSVLFIADSKEFSLLFRSSKNLKNVKSLDISAVNALDLLKYDNVFIEEKAFEEKILKVLK